MTTYFQYKFCDDLGQRGYWFKTGLKPGDWERRYFPEQLDPDEIRRLKRRWTTVYKE